MRLIRGRISGNLEKLSTHMCRDLFSLHFPEIKTMFDGTNNEARKKEKQEKKSFRIDSDEIHLLIT